MLLEHSLESTSQASLLVCELSHAGALRSLPSSHSVPPSVPLRFRHVYRARVPVSTSHTRKLACAIRAIILVSVSIDHKWTEMIILRARAFLRAYM